MTTTENSVYRRYSAVFDNIDGVVVPQIIGDARLEGLLEQAIRTGRALTRAEVEAAIPDVSWDECLD